MEGEMLVRDGEGASFVASWPYRDTWVDSQALGANKQMRGQENRLLNARILRSWQKCERRCRQQIEQG